MKQKLAIVVEGYFDCVLLWQAGLAHVVSPAGTALTPEQAKLLSRYTDRVILAFDADAAGQAASLRGIDVLVEAGFQVSVAQLPSGVDPDELVRTYGLKAFEDLVGQALNVVEFLLACAANETPLSDPDQKVRAAHRVLLTVARVPNAIRRREYTRLLAERLHLDEPAILEELAKVHTALAHPPTPVTSPPLPERRSETDRIEQLFVALILDDPSRFDVVVKDWALVEGLKDTPLRRILAAANELRAASPGLTPAQLISRLQEGEGARLIASLVQSAQREPAKEEAFRKCIERLRQRARQQKHAQMQEQLRLAQQLGHEDEVRRLLRQIQSAHKEEAAPTWAP